MKMNHARIAKLLKRAYHSWGVRAIAILLTVILCLQTVMSTGVPQVLAQEIGNALSVQSSDGASSDESTETSQNGSAPQGTETQNVAGGSSESNVSGEEDSSSTTTSSHTTQTPGEGSSHGSTTTVSTESDDATTPDSTSTDSTTENGNQTPDPSEESDSTSDDSTDEENENESNESEDSTEQDATEEDESEDTEDPAAPAERTDEYEWTGDLGALKLSSDGISIVLPDLQAESEDAADDVTTDDATTDEATEATDEGDEVELPEAFSASLNVSFGLNPANTDQKDTAPTSVIPGDSFEVTLPAGITPANPDATIDVFQTRSDGTPSTTKIAEATFDGNVLTVEFVKPVDTATGEARELTSYVASIDIDVLVSSELVDEPLHISFVKTDEENGTLAGATFSIAPADGDATLPDGSASKTFTSDEAGVVFADLQVSGSAEGTAYVITELAAPAGYEVAPAFTIVVFEDGTVELGEVPEELAGKVAVDNAVAPSEPVAGEDGEVADTPAAPSGVVVTLADTRLEAQLAKVSTGGGALTGAEFAVTGRFTDGYTTKAVPVDASGRAALEGLIVGETYRIRETVAPEGYSLIEGTWEFTVQADGTLAGEATSTSADEPGYCVSDDGVTLRAVDAPTPPIPGEMPGTGDSKLTYAIVLGIVSLACLAGGLRLSRRKR